MYCAAAPDGKISKNEILNNISAVLKCSTADIQKPGRLPGGLSNMSFVFTAGGEKYVYRHPGTGNGDFVNRKKEKRALLAAKKLGFDPTFLYMDDAKGWKISRYIPEFREPDYKNEDDSRKVAAVLRRLHTSGIRVDDGIRPWNDACRMEALVRKNAPEFLAGTEELRDKIRRLAAATTDDGVKKCFCHGDAYQPNWMILPDGKVILIDWEYAGMSDPGIDVGYYITDAGYDFAEAAAFIRLYLGESADRKTIFHFMAYVAITAWYWFIWALYRKTGGDAMDAYEDKWHDMAEKYALFLFSGDIRWCNGAGAFLPSSDYASRL